MFIISCRRIASITLMAFVMQLVLPFMANYHTANAQDLKPLFGDQILICTEDGFRFASIDEVDEHEPADDIACGLCYLASIGFNLKPTDHLTQASIAYAFSQSLRFLHEAAPIREYTVCPLTRAPPTNLHNT